MRSAYIDLLRKTADAIGHSSTGENSPVVVAPPTFSPAVAAAYTAQSIADPSRVLTVVAEFEGLEETQDQVRALDSRSLAAVPITVISHGQPQSVPGMPPDVNLAYEDAWQQMQIEIAQLSDKGRRVVASHAGHMIHHEEPDLVVHEIRTMLAIR